MGHLPEGSMCPACRDNAFHLQSTQGKCTEKLTFLLVFVHAMAIFQPYDHLEVLSPHKVMNISLFKAPLFYTFLEAETLPTFTTYQGRLYMNAWGFKALEHFFPPIISISLTIWIWELAGTGLEK